MAKTAKRLTLTFSDQNEQNGNLLYYLGGKNETNGDATSPIS
jgi:hypothetical protein